jgi:sec-independent protein translocase protein TatB
MFDVGFSEMVVIAVVALIVIGPERLPKVARTIGHLIGRMNRYVADVKADINREMEVEELRKFKEQFQDAAQSVQQTIHQELDSAQSGLNKIEESVAGVQPASPAAGASVGNSPASASATAAGLNSVAPSGIAGERKVGSA